MTRTETIKLNFDTTIILGKILKLPAIENENEKEAEDKNVHSPNDNIKIKESESASLSRRFQ